MTNLRYLVHDTPAGDVLIVSDEIDGAEILVSVHRLRAPLMTALSPWVPTSGTAPVEGSVVAETAADQLDEYFRGERREFELPIHWASLRGFHRAALEAVGRIPFGETASYGEVAIDAGSPGAARAVGTACASTPFSIVVPVHRVVRSDGSIGEYGGHPEIKRMLLDLEQAAGV